MHNIDLFTNKESARWYPYATNTLYTQAQFGVGIYTDLVGLVGVCKEWRRATR